MRVSPTSLPEVLLLEPEVVRDARGFVVETFNQRVFEATVGDAANFVLDVHSRSQRGVLRGLHYQLPPCAQGKLVRVIAGRVFDVVVDVRRSSPNFRRWFGVELDAEKPQQIWIPPGFAHGFLALSETAEVLYKTTSYYAPGTEGSVRWNDPDIGIEWPRMNSAPTLSARDAQAPALADALVFD
jgi:dTDP-4-dehydrorhamnose 3,5-epimerase